MTCPCSLRGCRRRLLCCERAGLRRLRLLQRTLEHGFHLPQPRFQLLHIVT